MDDAVPLDLRAGPGAQRAIAGWFGKIPVLGDLAARRLPGSFTVPWDDWLSQGLQHARAVLGERWVEVYLHAPLWRFALMPGTLGRHGWLGVLMPSVDRAGRYFPLMIAAAWSDPVPPLAEVEPWLSRLSAAALDCLAPSASLEGLEAALLELPAPWGGQDCDPDPAPLPAELPTRMSAVGGLQAALGAMALPLMRHALQRASLWWPLQSEAISGSITVCRGLPAPHAFASLLDGSL
jgi:type VI secretion system protein ImpM